MKFWKKQRKVDTVEKHLAFKIPGFCNIAYNILDWLPQIPGTNIRERLAPQECPSTTRTRKSEASKISFFKRMLHRKQKKRKLTKSQDMSPFKNAFTTKELKLSKGQFKLVKDLGVRANENIPNFHKRSQTVSWGGPGGSHWWKVGHGSGLDGLDGARLCASYLRIMNYPDDFVTQFPFKMCAKEGCQAEVALAHTLEWREKYKPWFVTPAAIKENADGYVYYRGHSPSADGDGSGHSIVWFRIGGHKVVDSEAYFRVILNTLDGAVSDNLRRSQNKYGKYNVVLDGADFRLSMMPSMNDLKRGILMMQDHFPDRLGMLFIANMSRVGEILLKMIMPLISKEVREKIKLVPQDKDLKLEMLRAVIEEEFIPDYFGGTDTFFPDQSTYYSSKLRFSEEEGRQYMETMAYHS